MALLTVHVVAADRTVWTGGATLVSAPAADGDIGILPGHTPILATLRPGVVRIKPESGDPMEVHVSGGFLSVDDNQVMLVADQVQPLAGLGS